MNIIIYVIVFIFSVIHCHSQIDTNELQKYINDFSENNSNNYTQSISICDSLLALCKNNNLNNLYAEVLRQKGKCFFYAVNYSKALELFIESKEKFLSLDNLKGAGNANNNIAIVYDYLKLEEKGLEIHFENLELRKNINDSSGIATTLNNIGVYFKNKNNYTLALDYFRNSLNFVNVLDKYSLTMFFYNIGKTFTFLSKFDSAEIYLTRSFNLANKLKNKQLIKNVLENFGLLYYKQEFYELARVYQERSLKIAQELDILYEIESITHDLAHTYEKLGLFDKAYYMLMLNKDSNDKMKIDESSRIIKEFELTKEFAKEKKISELNNEKQNLILNNQIKSQRYNITVLSVLFFSLLIISINVYIALSKKKKQNKLLLLQQDEILAQKEEIQAQSKAIEIHRDELVHLNNEKDKFFSIIAHDLKSPFAGFLGLTKIIAEEYENLSKEEVIEAGVNLRESAVNLYKLLENLLEWSRIQRGVTDFNPEICFFDFLVTQNINIQSEVARQKEISIINKIQPGIKLLADIPMLNTILRNLLSNALKFTKRGGCIEIGTNLLATKFVEIYIKDNGIGIEKEKISKLFKIDEKISKPGTENEPSSGLGLLLIKEFIEKNRGKIRVESTLNIGTTFYFTLPLAD